MAVKIRLARIGKKKAPFYRVIAIDSRKKRDGAFLENLGTYDALKSCWVTCNKEGIDKWIACGAVLSESAEKLVKNYKIVADQKSASPVAS